VAVVEAQCDVDLAVVMRVRSMTRAHRVHASQPVSGTLLTRDTMAVRWGECQFS
jgi:hypothetical protein